MSKTADAAHRQPRPARASVWLDGKAAPTDPPAGGATRGRRAHDPATPPLDLPRITACTVRLLDAEGLTRFSMRRLAAELGVTAMSLYWYVDTKDDLLELALDAAFGELTLPDPGAPAGQGPAPDWRSHIRSLATGYRALLVRHPWVSPLIGTFLNIGPHSMAFAHCVQRVMSDAGLPPHQQTGGTSAVFQFVYGFGTIEGHFIQRCSTAGLTQDEYFVHAMGSIREQPRYADHFGSTSELMAARGGDTVEEMRERDFRVALDVLIAGIESLRTSA